MCVLWSSNSGQTTSQYTCCLSSARGQGSNQGHKRRTGLHCHHPAISARAEMTANTGASHPRTVRVHPQHGSHTMVSSARVGVVFSTWTCVCFSGGGAVRESQPSLQHALVPQSHTLCCERQGGMAVGGCTPVLARHAGTARRTLSTRGTAGKRPGYRRPAPQAAPVPQSGPHGPWASNVGC